MSAVKPVWEEPPNKGGWGRAEGIAKLLRTKPGRWALIGEYASDRSAGTTANRLRKNKAFLPGPFEFRSSGVKVYGRFVGGAK